MKVFIVGFLVVGIVVLKSSSVAGKTIEPLSDVGGSSGTSNSVLDTRIVNGTQARLGQFPYQIFFWGYTDDAATDLLYACGGIIIGANWVLTAAHCLDVVPFYGIEVAMLRIIAGFIDIYNPGQFAQDRLIAAEGNIHPHANFIPDTLENDIGLIRIASAYNLRGEFVKAAVLPSVNLEMEDHVGEEITISGFGRTSVTAQVSSKLLWATTYAISLDACRQNNFTEVVADTTFCCRDTRPPISSSCRGDSGGPAVMMVNNLLNLVGIVSFGPDDICGGDQPEGYTNVAKFITWISHVQAQHPA